MRLNETEQGQPHPLQFPCLLWEPTLDTFILATAHGTGTVIHAGRSKVLKLGMIIPFAASRWQYGDEDWDFIIPPPRAKITLSNKAGSRLEPGGLETRIQVVEE